MQCIILLFSVSLIIITVLFVFIQFQRVIRPHHITQNDFVPEKTSLSM